jgi:hypothetical protein
VRAAIRGSSLGVAVQTPDSSADTSTDTDRLLHGGPSSEVLIASVYDLNPACLLSPMLHSMQLSCTLPELRLEA